MMGVAASLLITILIMETVIIITDIIKITTFSLLTLTTVISNIRIHLH